MPASSRHWVNLAEALLADEPYLRHSRAVAARALELALAAGLHDDELDLAYLAGLCHEIGRHPLLAADGFAPTDGAAFLEASGQRRLAGLVACHGQASRQAELYGIEHDYEREDSLLADVLDAAEATVGPQGQLMSIPERLAELEAGGQTDAALLAALRSWPPPLAAVIDRLAAAGVNDDRLSLDENDGLADLRELPAV